MAVTEAQSAELTAASSSRQGGRRREQAAVPRFQVRDLWQAPFHDFPLRNEILFENLPLAPEMDVLEVGPGSGFTAYLLARVVREVTVLDVSPEVVQDLAGKLRVRKNVRLACADICSPATGLSLEQKFDAAFALDVLEYLKHPDMFFQNMFRALRPGGRLLVSFPNVPPPTGDGVTWFTRRKEIERLLREAGFRSCTLYRLSLNKYAATLYWTFHEVPMRLLRRVRASDSRLGPQTYDQTWAFKNRQRLHGLKFWLHCHWGWLLFTMRLVRPVFRKEPLADAILDNSILILARRQEPNE